MTQVGSYLSAQWAQDFTSRGKDPCLDLWARLFLLGTNLYLIGTDLYLIGTRLYFMGTELYLKGIDIYLNF